MTDDDDFEITLPAEYRYENRVAIGHTAAEWKFKQQEYNHRCAYCGIHKRATKERHLFRDHVIPVSRQGTDDITNIVPSCWRCNNKKGTALPGEYCLWGLVPLPRIFKRKGKGWL